MTERKIKWLSVDDVLLIHNRQIAQYGGTEGVRDEGLLESALERPKNLYHYAEIETDITALAASYAFGIAHNHPFLDGKKRTALVSCRAFLNLNGFDLVATQVEKYEKIIRLAEGLLSEQELADWVAERTQLTEEKKRTVRRLQES